MAPLKRSRVVLLLAGVVLLFVLVRWAHSLPPLADVAPPATCGNNRCEIGEKATVRIASPTSFVSHGWGTLQYGSFGRFIAPAGDLDADGITDIAVGGIKTVGGNYGNTGMIWFIKLNRDGTAKEISPTQPDYGYQTYPLTYGSAYATLGKINGIGDSMSVFSDLDDFSYGKQIVRAGANGQNVTIADFAATSIANIGDINGDGIPDVALGRGGADGGPVTTYGAGTVTIVTLSQTLAVLSSHTIPSVEDGFPSTVWPSTERGVYRFGKSVAALGDLNGDGKKEIAVGTGNGVWILSLNADGTVASKNNIVPGTSFSLNGESDDAFDRGLTGIGDWNGDGIPDMAVATANSVWLLFLNSDKTVKSTRVIYGSDLGAFFSQAVSYGSGISGVAALPDMDGDGKQELAVADATSNSCGPFSTADAGNGIAHILFSKTLDACPKDCNWCTPQSKVTVTQGSALSQPSNTTPSTCNNGSCDIGEWNPIYITGPVTNVPNSTAYNKIIGMGDAALGDLGDFDGDGAPDIVAAGRVADGQVAQYPLPHNGEVALISLNRNGSQKSVRRIFEGTGGLLTGRDSAKSIGAAVAVLGDIDGDGVKDLAVTSVDTTVNPNMRSVYILVLNRNGTVKSWKELTSQDIGGDPERFLGAALAALGDFDGDGIPDLAVGEPGAPNDWITGAYSKEGRLHLLFLNRDGTIKSKKTYLGSAFWGDRTDGEYAYISQRTLFGSPLVFLGDLFHDGRRLLIAGSTVIFFNADGSVNSFRTLDERPLGLADVGDQNGDGRDELAMVSARANLEDYTIYSDGTVKYYSIAGNGDLSSIASFSPLQNTGTTGEPNLLPARFMASVADLDGDGRRELVFSDDNGMYCAPGIGYGNAGLVLSGVTTNPCPNDCDRVNYCSGSFGVTSSPTSSVVSSSSAAAQSSSSVTTLTQSSSSVHSSSSSSSSHVASSSSVVTSSSSVIQASSSSHVSSSITFSSSSFSTSLSSSHSTSPASTVSSAFVSSAAYDNTSSVDSQTSAASSRVSSYTQQYSSISFTDDSIPSPRCGDGQLSPSEECDTGHPCPDGGFCMSGCRCQARSSAARSSPSFLPPQFSSFSSAETVSYSIISSRCGDGQLDASEECDTNEPCPDGAFCSASCQCETRARSSRPFLAQGTAHSSPSLHPSLATPPSRSSSFCGNATLEYSESCDDGNTVNGDGCTSFCQKETPNVVASQPLCGNGIVEEGEQCDPPGTLPGPPGQAVRTGRAGDGNPFDQDGCSAFCTFEILPVTNADGSFRPSVIAGSTDPSLFLSSTPSIARIGPTPKKSPSAPSVDHSYPSAPASNVPSTVAPFSIATLPQQPTSWQYQASTIPYAPAGPVGATGPASLAVMAAGAAAGFASMRRKKRG